MARSYAKLLIALWADDSDFRLLAAGPQRLYMVLLSNPKLSTAGCLPWQANKWAKLAADTSLDQVAADLTALTVARFILCDETTEEVLIRTFVRHDGGVRNPNLRKSIVSAIAAIESPHLRAAATAELEKAQRTDSGQRHPEGHPEGRDHDRQQEGEQGDRQGDRQGDTEPTYILHPSSLIPDPSSNNPHPSSADESANNSGSAAPNSDDDGVINRIITICAALRTERRQPRPGDPGAYQTSIIADMQRTERAAIAAMLIAKPYMRTMTDKAAAWHEITRTQQAAG